MTGGARTVTTEQHYHTSERASNSESERERARQEAISAYIGSVQALPVMESPSQQT